ncbi:hypothetical protein FIU94_12760 [Sulfitobacter sp. THAF37]|uniref:aggregation factor core n=1 Tax=Sulfitobacter sp. THAF37 TaxID=2587855 RepID=UPI00126948B1|nr:aggregation factor core [Sulfitobacter sp. THAF37]QFT59698.1 hypothetical protein FIU94_12760 [Sulfitobacter sp. THAF37]
MIRTATCLLLLWAGSAQADLSLRFIEGAPEDRFVLTNDGTCPLAEATLTLDIGAAPAGLLFDTTPGGAGVDVHQPFEVIEGRGALLGLPDLSDGDTVLTLNLAGLPSGGAVSFSLDVDDSGTGRPETIAGSEIEGAMVTLVMGETTLDMPFSDQAVAVIPIAPCTS